MFSKFSPSLSESFSFQRNSFGSNPFRTPSNSTFGSTSGSEFTNSFSTTAFTSEVPATEPNIGKEPETEPEKVVKTPTHETEIFGDSSMKGLADVIFKEVIEPQLTRVMETEDYKEQIEGYREEIEDLKCRLSAFRRFMYAKGLEHSYEQWLTKRIRSAKEEDNDEPLSISLQHGMKDVEIMRD